MVVVKMLTSPLLQQRYEQKQPFVDVFQNDVLKNTQTRVFSSKICETLGVPFLTERRRWLLLYEIIPVASVRGRRQISHLILSKFKRISYSEISSSTIIQ